MNCCNDAGHCTNGRNGTPCAARTREVNPPFDWEGLKESYSLPPVRVNTRADAPPTGIHFAPGAIERHTRPRSAFTRSLRQLGAAIVLCAAAAGGGLLAAAVIRVIEGA